MHLFSLQMGFRSDCRAPPASPRENDGSREFSMKSLARPTAHWPLVTGPFDPGHVRGSPRASVKNLILMAAASWSLHWAALSILKLRVTCTTCHSAHDRYPLHHPWKTLVTSRRRRVIAVAFLQSSGSIPQKCDIRSINSCSRGYHSLSIAVRLRGHPPHGSELRWQTQRLLEPRAVHRGRRRRIVEEFR